MKDNIMKKTEFHLSQTVMRLAELGLDESEIVYSLGITKRKFAALKEQKEIANALASGEETRARKVEDALYRRAVGFEYEELVNASTSPSPDNSSEKRNKTCTGRTANPAKSAEKTSAKSTIKTVIPDVTACIFWLKNRQPGKWRDSNDKTNHKKPLIEAMEDYDEEPEIK
jgi:hypothetical protein